LTITGQARAAVSGGVVCAAFSDGYVEAYRLADGSSLWSRPLSLRGGDFVDADADPVFVNKSLYVASYSDGIYALNIEDGQTRWQRPAPSVTTLAAFESLLIAASADGYVWGLEQSGGVLVYRTRLSPGPPSRLLIRDHLAAFTMGENGLVVLDPLSGEPLQASAFGDLFAGDVSWVGDDLTFLGSSGYLYALRRVH
jgi:outer membrane protein assembly factor BamB